MCGIAGLLRNDRRNVGADVARMSAAIAPRGPDDLGYMADGVALRSPPADGCRLALAHRRLSILDLTEAGWQPLAYGPLQIVFNGEIYNYRELRAELQALGHTFRTHSDTEVLLAAYHQWGQAALPRLVGMFAFAIFDPRTNTLFLARDPFGIKPLYYATWSGGLAFASEAKALLTLPEVSREANPARLYDYLRFGLTDHGAETLLAGIHQLPAAHCATVALDGPTVAPQRYWQLAPTRRDDLSFEQAAQQLRELFLESVDLHLRSDVPVGAALSGGIDSSAIVCAMRQLAPAIELHTFGYVSDDPAASEERYMDLVGRQVGAVMHKVSPAAAELVADLDRMITAQDFPFAGTSMYAQYRVFALAQGAGIKVMLDGQGADELLGGYRFYLAARLASLLRQGRWLEGARFTGRLGTRLLFQAGGLLLPPGLQGPARRMVGEDLAPAWLAPGWFAERGVVPRSPHQARGLEILRDQLGQAVQTTSLPALLRYEDRNSMAHGVESRVPFLTPKLADFLLSLPEAYLIAPDGTSKAVFRAAMKGLVPADVLARRDKLGFTTPEARWLEDLAPWIDQVLAGEAAQRIAPLDLKAAKAEWQAVRAGQRPFSAHVWRWINLIRWAERHDVHFAQRVAA